MHYLESGHFQFIVAIPQWQQLRISVIIQLGLEPGIYTDCRANTLLSLDRVF